MGMLLIAAPWIFGLLGGGIRTWLPVVLGAGIIAYSLFTDYELGVVRRLSMPVHLWLDGLGGLLLAVSPWLFGFSDTSWLPYVVLGVLEIGAALFTRKVPSYGEGRAPAAGRP